MFLGPCFVVGFSRASRPSRRANADTRCDDDAGADEPGQDRARSHQFGRTPAREVAKPARELRPIHVALHAGRSTTVGCLEARLAASNRSAKSTRTCSRCASALTCHRTLVDAACRTMAHATVALRSPFALSIDWGPIHASL